MKTIFVIVGLVVLMAVSVFGVCAPCGGQPCLTDDCCKDFCCPPGQVCKCIKSAQGGIIAGHCECENQIPEFTTLGAGIAALGAGAAYFIRKRK